MAVLTFAWVESSTVSAEGGSIPGHTLCTSAVCHPTESSILPCDTQFTWYMLAIEMLDPIRFTEFNTKLNSRLFLFKNSVLQGVLRAARYLNNLDSRILLHYHPKIRGCNERNLNLLLYLLRFIGIRKSSQCSWLMTNVQKGRAGSRFLAPWDVPLLINAFCEHPKYVKHQKTKLWPYCLHRQSFA